MGEHYKKLDDLQLLNEYKANLQSLSTLAEELERRKKMAQDLIDIMTNITPEDNVIKTYDTLINLIPEHVEISTHVVRPHITMQSQICMSSVESFIKPLLETTTLKFIVHDHSSSIFSIIGYKQDIDRAIKIIENEEWRPRYVYPSPFKPPFITKRLQVRIITDIIATIKDYVLHMDRFGQDIKNYFHRFKGVTGILVTYPDLINNGIYDVDVLFDTGKNAQDCEAHLITNNICICGYNVLVMAE